jgi:aminoglycoside phosphotransferase (APT) family kinase protein
MTEEASEEYFQRLVDEDALERLLEAELGGTDRYEVRRHAEGHSNETLFVTWGDRELVIRRPPPGETASGAHDVLREYRVQDALQDSSVPVAPTILVCEDEAVLGSEFYVMERLEGDVVRLEEPDRFADPERREQVGLELIETLAAIHQVDYDAVGLSGFGRPEGFTERQVDIWSRQFDWAYDVTAAEREIPQVQEIRTYLEDNVPSEAPHTLVHGDFKLDNVMYGPGLPPEIVAVFDWELSSFGNPLTDLGWMFAFWRDAGDPSPVVPGLIPQFVERDGYPSRRDLVDHWESATGIEFTNATFYRTLGMFKLVAVCEMFYRRYLEGNSDDPLYPEMETAVPELADRTMAIVRGDHPL